MKILAVLALTGIFSSAFAAEKFGGVTFYSSVESHQIEALKNDLRYLYKTPITKKDSEFLSISGMAEGDGKNMHNWLLNRVKYVVGENFELNDENIAIGIVQSLFFKFPNTPLPPILVQEESEAPAPEVGPVARVAEETPVTSEGEEEGPKVRTIMSNLGGAVYLMGKQAGVVLGIKADGEKVYAQSPRVGILQVGEGLFFEDFLYNKNVNAPINSVSRLGTLFHEARHSDGTGISTGFLHDLCPETHSYAGNYACEVSGNGPYTIGGLSERHLIQNCTECSQEEVTAMIMNVADSFSRVLDDSLQKRKAALESQLMMLMGIAEFYEDQLKSADETLKAAINAELEKLKIEYNELAQNLIKLMVAPDSRPAFRDATPEGKVEDLTVKQTSKMMEKSLR